MSHLFLTGFMGAGKTTVGGAVAARLKKPFMDLDAEIEAREGASVPDLFRERGEEGFRDAEHEALAALDGAVDAVVATGGGSVLRDDNRVLLHRLGTVVYLAVTPEETMARLGDTDDRPLLSGGGLSAATEILAARLALYAATADHVVDTTGLDVESVADAVLEAMRAPEPTILHVQAGARGYDVAIAEGLLDQAGACLARATDARRAAVIGDSNTGPRFGKRVSRSLEEAGFLVFEEQVDAGESSKSWQIAGDLLERLALAGLGRDSVLVALGGGVVGDLVGFCAATYLRGVDLVHIPTTLLAQVDSAIGGKTGVDLVAGKNLAGAFWPPRLVLADTGTLTSLPVAEWQNGLVETAKAALLSGEEALARFERDVEALLAREPTVVSRSVATAAAFKVEVVSADERESDLRESLNLGHTLGHAIEVASGYGTVSHGVAVAEGLRFAARLAERIAGAPASLTQRTDALLARLGVAPLAPRPVPSALLDAMRADKKARAGTIRFVLLSAPGDWQVVPVEDGLLLEQLGRWSDGAGKG